MNNKMHHVIKG